MLAIVWPLIAAFLKRTILARLMSKWTGTGLGVLLGLIGIGLAALTIWRVATSDDEPPRYTAKQAAAACDSALLKSENDALKDDLRRLAARLAERGERLAEMTDKLQALEKDQDDARATSADPRRVVVPADDRWLLARARRTGTADAAGPAGR